MNSRPTSTLSDESVWLTLTLALGIAAYTHRAALIEVGITAASVIIGLAWLAVYTYGAVRFLRRMPRVEPSRPERPVPLSEPPPQPAEPEWVQEHHPAKQEPRPPEQLRKLTIDLDGLLRTPLHRAEGLLSEEIDVLQRNGYQLKEFVPLGEIRRQPFYIRECKPESLEHTFVVHSIAHKLKECVSDVRTYVTQMPDIVFTLSGKEYALEIETPLFLRKKHNRLVAKAKANNTAYGRRWWFVTTRSAYARSFRRYGKVLTRNKIDPWLQELIPE